MPAVAQPTEAARTIAVFILAEGQRGLMRKKADEGNGRRLMDG
jgi:hypothetical protein